MKTTTPFFSIVALALASFAISCSDSQNENADGINAADTVKTDPEAMKFQGEIFSVPSPVQIAVLMQQAGATFDKAMLNSLDNRDKYVSERKKSLNLGVYGADLAYISNFNDVQMSQQYFDVMGKLAGDLNILDKLDPGLMKRFRDNMEMRDSLLALNASFYREGNRYLKQSERHEVAAMVVIGGWVEALHLACNAAKTNPSIRNKVGEQGSAISGLKKILSHLSDEDSKALSAKFDKLTTAYASLPSTYTYVEPIDDLANKTTYFNSKTSVSVSDEQLAEVSGIVEEIRNSIIQ